MQPSLSADELKPMLSFSGKGEVKNTIQNCLTVFQQADLNDVREKISELREKEKAIISRNMELENTRIVQIVQLSNLNGSQLKEMLTKIKQEAVAGTPTTSVSLTKIERKTENEEIE